MNQFTPVSELLSDYPELNHTISASDYDALVDYAIDIDVENGFIQEGETAEESFMRLPAIWRGQRTANLFCSVSMRI